MRKIEYECDHYTVDVNEDIILMCPSCYNYYKFSSKIKINLNSVGDDSKVGLYANIQFEFKCPVCGHYRSKFEVDQGIVKAIQILNKKKYFTAFCCEGHLKGDGNPGKAYVKFKYETPEVIPRYWIDAGDLVIECYFKSSEGKMRCLKELQDWAEDLPVYKGKEVNPNDIVCIEDIL